MLDSLKNRMSEKVKEAELRRSGGTPEQASFHRRAYHRNFEGYTEVRELNQYGRTVIRRVYTGKYYEPELEPFRRLTLRMFYLLFFAGGTALFLYGATRHLLCNRTLYVNLFQAVEIPMLLWCIYVLAFYIPSMGKLTAGEYDTQHGSLMRATRMAAVCMWLTAAAAVVCTLLHLDTEVLANLLCAAGFAASGALVFLIYLFESNLNYTVTNSTNSAPEEGVEIDCD